MTKPKKPKDLVAKLNGKDFIVAQVFESWFAEHFAGPDELQATRDVVLFDDNRLFDGLSYKDQAKVAKAFGGWLLRYSRWIDAQPERRDPFA